MSGSNSDGSSTVNYIVSRYKLDDLYYQKLKTYCKKTDSDWNSITEGVGDIVSLR